MKRRFWLAFGAAVAGLGAFYPWVHPHAQSDLAAGNQERPFTRAIGQGEGHGAAQVSLAIFRTSQLRVPEALVLDDGSFGRNVTMGFSGFLIRHGEQVLAFDLGLGSQIDAQYSAEMPMWARSGFRYGKPVDPMISQLAKAGLPVPHEILLSHTHWDHGSGLEDFPQANVWITGPELAAMRHTGSGAGSTWMSQLGRKGTRLQKLDFSDGPYRGFTTSHDLFGDGSVVAVPMPGHTAGAMGLFVNVSSGRRFLLVGDTIWNTGQLNPVRGKFWAASAVVDADAAANAAMVERLAELHAQDPALEIVPAHDGGAQERLGLFPHWLE